MVTTTLKWMLGPPGIGLLYVRGDLMERLPLADVGYLRAQFEGPWPRTEVPDYPSIAATLELGIAAVPGLAAAGAGIDLIRSVGIDAIAGRIERLMARLVPELSERGFLVNTPEQPERRGGVLSARHPKAAELGQWLADRRIRIGGFPGGTVRIDPHGYNDDGDIDRLLAGIDEFLAQEGGR
jgi:cysteine desulfurase/selenocysteine lyase